MNAPWTSLRAALGTFARDFADLLTGLRFALGATMGLWVGDAVLLAATRAGAGWGQWAQGMGGAAFVALSPALVVGGFLGPVLVPLVRPLAQRAGTRWAGVRSGETEARHSFLALMLAVPLLLGIWAAALYRVTILILFALARPESIAGAMVLSDLAFTVLLLALWSEVISGAQKIVGAASHVPGLRWFVDRAWPLPALLVLAGLAASAKVVAAERAVLSALPWHMAIPFAGLVVGVAVAAYLPRGPSCLRAGALWLTVVVLSFGFAAAMRMRPESAAAQTLAFGRALSGRAGYAAWRFAADFDRDGQISLFGGGDCAPFDRRRYTGAPEVPGDGVDEDCDGLDSLPALSNPRPPLKLEPDALPAHANVIFVTVDALAAPEVSASPRGEPLMPRLAELARRSMSFDHCSAQGPSTRMSFPSMFTSRWDSEQTFESSIHLPYSFSERERTLQQAFADARYETAAVIPNVYFSRARWRSLTNGFKVTDDSALASPTGKHDAREVTDAALRILSEPRPRPLYLWVHYYDAHPPYEHPPGVKGGHADDRRYYEEELGYLDRELGRLIDAIDARTDPAYLVLTADHATSFHPVPSSRRYHYGYDLYTSTLHVPLIFHGPGLRTGRNDDVVSTMDVAPTLANLFSLDDFGRFEGTSLAPELMTGAHDSKRVTFHEIYLPEHVFHGTGDPLEMVSLRTDQYDLILNRGRGTFELYDWPVDYYEQHDLYEDEARSPEVMHLRSLLGAFLQEHGRGTLPSPHANVPPAEQTVPVVEE